MAKVFQYGSNCDTERLNSRCRLRGKACSLGKAQTVCNFEIAFDVWSCGNCCAAADLIQRGDTPAWGVLYEIPADGLKTLECIEGPNYESRCIEVVAGGETTSAITFVVKESARVYGKPTSAKYVGHIVKGLRCHAVPEEYVCGVISAALANLRFFRASKWLPVGANRGVAASLPAPIAGAMVRRWRQTESLPRHRCLSHNRTRFRRIPQ